jgi:hypothetical protein
MSSEETEQGVTDAAAAREELYATLSYLKDRLNYAQRVDNAIDDVQQRIAARKKRNPVAFTMGVAGAAVIAGLAVWGVAASIARRLE